MPDDEDERRLIEEVVGALRRITELGIDAGAAGASALGTGVEESVRRLVDHRIGRALRDPSSVPALGSSPQPSSSGSLARRLGTRGAKAFAVRKGMAGRLAGRHPAGLALRYGPAVVDAVQGNLTRLDAVAAHLVRRARGAGVEPDPERLARVVVQVLADLPVDADDDVSRAVLLKRWARDVGRSLLPFGGGGDRDDAHRAAADAVDPRSLA